MNGRDNAIDRSAGIKGRRLLMGLALPALAILATAASGADVQLNVGPDQPVVIQPSPAPPVVIQPPVTATPGTTVVVPGAPAAVPAAPTTLLADDIHAREVRAQAIYANKIKAREVQGLVHQTREIDVGKGKADVKAPVVTAGVIYADVIRADSVVANDIYVRDLARE
jgi:hypothetical protein